MPYAPDLSGCALDGRYELHAVIGEGAFGRVYRGRDRRLERWVAIKLIKPWWAEDPDWAPSFEREARLLARVSDPRIVQIYDVGHADEGLYYVSELVEGESLAARLRRGPLTVRDAATVAEELCRALARAHQAGVVHRDIKPGNILISADGHVKVGDFGVARLAEGSTDGATATVVGTPRYMAPEQARGRRTTAATDVYSAGIVLYEMLAGQPPFTERAAVELALRHVSEPPPPLPSRVPKPLAKVVGKALAKDPAKRYADGGEMAEALERTLRAAPSKRRGSVRPSRTDDRKAGTAAAAGRRPRTAEAVAPTRRAPKLTARRNLNPAARRRTIAALTLAFGLLVGMIITSLVIGATGHVRIPRLVGLTRAQITAKTTRLALNARFGRSYSRVAKGRAIAQRPASGQRVAEGSTVRVVLSKGPRPIKVPQLAGDSLSQAQSVLAGVGLRARATTIVAPGVPAGQVTSQSPAPGARLVPTHRVALTVAEAPQWRPITSMSGSGNPTTVNFHVQGPQWRVVYTMSYQGACTFIFWCSGPGLEVDNANGAAVSNFGLSDGGRQEHVFHMGAGEYRMTISPGSDTAQWTAWIEDWY
jgi:serine/threonine-protein kinase